MTPLLAPAGPQAYLQSRRPLRVLFAAGTVGSAAAAGSIAALGWGGVGIGVEVGIALLAAGALLPVQISRMVVLAALLFTPDFASGMSAGLQVTWSHGLTLSNFLVPALALPLLGGAWLAGRRVLPQRWPPLARWTLLLLVWCALTLVVPAVTYQITAREAVTLIAHWSKLVSFVALGAVLSAGIASQERRQLRCLLCAGIVVNAAAGLAQVAGFMPVFSPLAGSSTGLGVRASGLFYDVNMYAVMMAWALLWLLVQPVARGAGRWLYILLTLAVAASLVAAGSRAGYAAVGTGAVVLLLWQQWKPLAWIVALSIGSAFLFPLRTWTRITSSTAVLEQTVVPAIVTDSRSVDRASAERLQSMAEALRQIAAKPILGLGFGRALYLGVPDRPNGAVARGNTVFRGAQNMPLTVLTETGPIGLLLFLAAITATVVHLRRLGAAAAPLLAGFVGLLAANLTLEALWNARLLSLGVIVTCGSVLALPDRIDSEEQCAT